MQPESSQPSSSKGLIPNPSAARHVDDVDKEEVLALRKKKGIKESYSYEKMELKFNIRRLI